jgi:DNA-binding response OmpR family regulator
MRVAILEDDRSQADLLAHWLELAGHHWSAFDEGAQLLRTLQHDTFDVLLLDWNVPGVSGMGVLRQVREQMHLGTPVVICTARGGEADVVEALRAGADDYVVKPMQRMELLARLDAVTRRRVVVDPSSEVLAIGGLRVNLAARQLLCDDTPVVLTAKDFDLSVLFLRHVGRLLSRKQIRECVWRTTAEINSRSLDTHVSRIRRKLHLTPENGWRLSAVYGYGYRLERFKAPV